MTREPEPEAVVESVDNVVTFPIDGPWGGTASVTEPRVEVIVQTKRV